MKYICQYCGKECKTAQSLSYHQNRCKLNPNAKHNIAWNIDIWTKERILKYNTDNFNNKFIFYFDKDEYKRNDKIKFICPDDGEIEQTITQFINSPNGCIKCSKRNAGKNKSKEELDKWKYSRLSNLKIWKQKCDELHNNKYDYSLCTEYNGNRTVMKIICPIHGEFKQKAYKHIAGHGCPYCGAGGGKGTTFLKIDKLNLLTKHDLLSMSWSVILDLIGENKLPKEFNQLCKFGENTPERKKMIEDLIDTYNIEVDNEGDENDVIDNENDLNTNIETKVNDIDDEIYDDIENEDVLKPYKEIKDLGELLDKEFDEILFSTGDKWVHIMSKEIGKLWNNVLRDNEKHNENTINEIHQKLKNNSLTKFEKYVYEEFIKEYNEVINLEIH